MGERILGADSEGRQAKVTDEGRVTIGLFPPEIMERTEEIREKTKALLMTAKEKGLIDRYEGDLNDLLNEVAGRAFADDANSTDGIEELRASLFEFRDFYESPETKSAMPFFGIGVSEDPNTGEPELIFAD